MADTSTYINQTIPKALADLNQSHVNIEQIAQYCKNAYAQESDKAAVFNKTQLYIKDALSNVAYHIHTVGLHFTNFLQIQANEIDRLDLQLKTIGDRMNLSHENVGKSGFRTVEATKSYDATQKIQKLQDETLPENAKPVTKFVRQPINLKALDNVGIDLSGHKGTESFSSAVQAPQPIQAPPPSLASPPPLNQPGVFAPPQVGPPPPPPPIGLSPPPSLLPPPPPMMGLDDAPPPPPLGEDDMLPPPPPMEDLPPPPPFM